MTCGLLAADSTNSPPATHTNTNASAAPSAANPFQGFLIERGFRLDLVASEPMVMDPTAMAFDENGRLFVLESPQGAGSAENQLGRVRLLQDTDGDGVFDKTTIYAAGLEGPTALVCYEGGVYVNSGNQILYLRDSRGNGVADVRREVLRGFGGATNGVQGRILITSMVWGMDERVHVGTAGHSGDIFSSNEPKRSVVLSQGNFSFDPRSLELIAESGIAATGMCFDSRGRNYVSSATEPMLQVMYDARYAGRNPFYTMPPSMLDVARGETIFQRIGATAQARQFTSATGLVIYRGSAFPLDYWENAFVIDSATRLIHRDKLKTAGIEVEAERPSNEPGFEFLSMNNGLFQPVTLANAPDGTLYVAGVLSKAATARQTNAASASLAGRIIRVAPLNFKQPAPVQMGKATTAQLVAALRDANGWHRDTASRLLYERQDKAAILPLTQLALDVRASPISRLHAIHALAGLQALSPAHLARLLTDGDERVREHSVLLSERFIGVNGRLPDVLSGLVTGLAADASPRVRCQVAFTLGQVRQPTRNQALANCLRGDPGNRWVQAAVMSSAGEGAGEIFAGLASDAGVRANEESRNLLGRLVSMVGARDQSAEATAALHAIQAIPEPELAFSLALSLSDSLQRLDSSLASVDVQGALEALYARAMQVASDPTASENLQMAAIQLLQTSRYADVQVAVSLLQRWQTLSPLMRMDAVVAMLARPERTGVLLTGLESRVIPFSDLTSVQIRFLLSNRDPAIRQRALSLFGAYAMQDRRRVVNQYSGTLQLSGSSERGHGIYEARCALCHQDSGDGNPIGIDLADSDHMSREQLFVKILDPNRNLPRDSAQSVVVTKDGATFMGFIAEKDGKSITLCQPNGESCVVGRKNIVLQDSLGVSAMPEGLEAGLTAQDLADLLEYLKPSSGAAR